MPDQSPFIWHELVTADQPTSGAFFSRLFGWTRKEVDAGPFGTYTLFQINGQDVAGMMNPTPDTPGKGSFWHSYIAVEDVDACAKRASSLGGNVLVAPHDVTDVGRKRDRCPTMCRRSLHGRNFKVIAQSSSR